MERKLEVGIALTLLAGVALVLGYLIFGGGAIVSAEGVSNVKAQPDVLSVVLNIEGRNESAATAKDIQQDIADNVVLELLRLGIDKEDIQLGHYNIYQDYEWSEGGRKDKGFVARQEIIVKTNEFEMAPEIVDVAVDSGALISYINFELSPEKESDLKIEALEQAGKDAKKKAEATASGLGKSLGGLVSVESQDFYYPGPIAFYESGEGKTSSDVRAAAANIAPREIDVNARLIVKYKLRNF